MNAHPFPETLRAALPPAAAPIGTFRTAVTAGNLVWLSGVAPLDDKGRPLSGKVGDSVTPEEARRRARLLGLALLANLQAEIGDLGRVRRVVKLLGFVNAVPDFTAHPQVIDGCSEVFLEAFGSAGRHARSAIGVASLPNDISVEAEAVFEIADEA